MIAGAGEELVAPEREATPNMEFVGKPDDGTLRQLMNSCRALVFAGEEDFGIVPVEVLASGRPVLAFASGGALETVVDGKGPVLA